MSTVTITPGTGSLGITGHPASPRVANIPVLYLPGIALVPNELNYDQTVQLASDQFEVAMNDSYAYLNRVEFAALSTGLLDPYLVPQFVEHISAGVIDEIELHVQPNKLASVLRGRDKASYAADSTLYLVYSVNPAQPVAPEVPPAIPGFPALPIVPGVTVPLVLHGFPRASDIARDLCRRVGLNCIWSTHDYFLREDITVNGSVISVLQSLIEPFSHFERSKTDIWADGDTLVIKARDTAPASGLLMDAHDSRITDLMVRAKFSGNVRVLRIIGSATGTENIAVDPGDKTEVTEDQTLDPDTNAVTERVVTTTVIRSLDNAQKRQTVQTFSDTLDATGITLRMHLVSEKLTISDWDDLELVYPNTIVNRPKENNRVTIESGFDPANPDALAPLNRTSIIHSYDLLGYLHMQETRKEVWDTTPTPRGPNGWVLDSKEVKMYEKNGAGLYQITSTQYGSDGTPGDVRRTIANGPPPGGPGRGTARSTTNDRRQVTYATLISTEPGAKDVTITNKSLLPEHMLIIANQAKAQSGSTEVEISATLAGCPWLKRGMYIILTGLTAEDGTTPIVFQNALVSEARIEYRESSGNPTYLTYMKALYWEAGRI